VFPSTRVRTQQQLAASRLLSCYFIAPHGDQRNLLLASSSASGRACPGTRYDSPEDAACPIINHLDPGTLILLTPLHPKPRNDGDPGKTSYPCS